MLILPLLLEKIWMSSKLVQRVDGWDPANLPEIVLLRCTWPEKPDFFTLLEMLYLPMHFSMGALGGFHIWIKTWPRLIGRDVSNILFPKARRVAADHKNILLIDKESTAPIRCMSKNKQLFAFKQKHQTKYKRCSYFSTFRHLPMGNPQACRNVFCKSKKLLQLVQCRPPPPVLCGRFDPGWNRILTCGHTTCN